MRESLFEELLRYVGFTTADADALRRLAPDAEPAFPAIADAFYERVSHHDDAARVFADQAHVQRLKGTLQVWMRLLLRGPWDAAYYQTRARIGRKHVEIGLPQRYMFGAMDVIRLALVDVATSAFADALDREPVLVALHKIIDLELAIMLETYAEASLARTQRLERFEKDVLVRELALSEARYQEIVEKGEALIVTWQPGLPIILFNRRCEALTGLSRERVRGRTWADLFGDASEHEAALLAGQRVPPFETTTRDPQGREHTLRWRLTTLVEPARTIVCAIGLDVTEEHALAVRTRRAERLASLGTMAAGLAHEIRNPLNSAHLQLTLVARRLGRAKPDVSGARDAASLAAGEVARLASLVGEFLDFARPQPLRRTTADLRQTAEVIAALVAPEASAANIDLALEPGAPVFADYDDEKIKQVFHNLVRNAVEATGPGGTVRLRIARRDGEAVIEVEDDGPGFAPDAPVFEPFFTTKEAGTGLGLAIVHRIVSDHGGTIDARSRPGQTVLAVSLPLGTVP